MKNSILITFLSCFATLLTFQHSSAQTPTTSAFFSGFWTCPDSLEIQSAGHIPGSLHQSLIRSEIIPDPFVGVNEEKVQWVGEKTWVFTSSPFDLDDSQKVIEAQSVQLYSKWYLNDILIGTTDNAFLAQTFNLHKAMKATGNILKIEFSPPSKFEKAKLSAVGYPLPGDEKRAIHRMPQFAFGWDWGPKLLDMSVKGLSYKDLNNSINHINLETIELGENSAKCIVGWSLEGDFKEPVSMRWALTNDSGVKVAWGSETGNVGDFTQEFDLKFPELWWTHDLGNPYLYNLEVIAFNNTGLLGRTIKKVGIRTLELNTDNDGFQFILNGQAIYSMGSNIVPSDIIPNKVYSREEKSLVDAAIEANMNTLRVWGGGNYASDVFMEYCDEMGVLVWHDFMFACAMYPGDDDFVASVKSEAEYQCKRLRHHPSLAIWCGNNEVSEGWERWGWKEGLSESDIGDVGLAYDKIFKDLLPQIVFDLDDAPYWESSPKLGRGDSNFKNKGDAHDWGIWHDGYSFDSLWSRVPRFMSEYGFQSFPEKSTFSSILSHDSIMSLKDFRIHPEIVAHEKHSRGFDIIDAYMQRTHGYLISDSLEFEDWAYLSRVIQAEGIAEGAIAGRLNQDHCSGTLVWQLNDCWPVASWSSIDGHGRWKLLHNKLKEAFQPILLHGLFDEDVLTVGITANPGAFSKTIQGTLIVNLKSLDGQIINSEIVNLSVSSAETNWLKFKNLIPVGSNINNIVVQLHWKEDDASDALSASDKVYLVNPGELNLKKSSIFIERFGWSGDSYIFEISANTFVKSVELYSLQEGNFSENGFDLFPGETIRVSFNKFDVDAFAPGMGDKKNYTDPHIMARSLNDFITK